MIFSFVSRISLAFRFCILIRNEIVKFWPMTSLRTYDFPYFFVFFIILCFDGQPAWKLGVVTVAHDHCELQNVISHFRHKKAMARDLKHGRARARVKARTSRVWGIYAMQLAIFFT